MKRPVSSSAHVRSGRARAPRGYTMIEILMATLLTLILMFAVVTIFASISGSINDSRSTLEMTDRLRATAARLQEDLKYVTVTMLPPRRPEEDGGYFEYTEGVGGPVAMNTMSTAGIVDDSTVGDYDDILMFTTRSPKNPFIGRFGTGTIESHVAEVMWFVRGRTLYRRVLLVAPHVTTGGNGAGFYAGNDISVRNEGGVLIANTLGDLTKRECRFAHPTDVFPYDARRWGQLGLPTLRECSAAIANGSVRDWVAGGMAPSSAANTVVTAVTTIDLWNNPHPWGEVDTTTGTLLDYMGPRVAEDVILTNVVGFDVKVWDPRAPVFSVGNVALVPGDPSYPDPATMRDSDVISYGAYVDLGYAPSYRDPTGVPKSNFCHTGHVRSGLVRVYDTWSFHYEHDGLDQDAALDAGAGADQGTNGFDDVNVPSGVPGVVDDAGEMETAPPYPVPLRGIQIKIRTFEPDSRQVREVTVIQDFLPK